ncbi:hypothetical protein [Leptolyngbya sp. FACHB-60]|nr:hypothetical protein [Leptolyngbya sp. FACHB-60]
MKVLDVPVEMLCFGLGHSPVRDGVREADKQKFGPNSNQNG